MTDMTTLLKNLIDAAAEVSSLLEDAIESAIYDGDEPEDAPERVAIAELDAAIAAIRATPRAAVVINMTGDVLQGASATLPLDVYVIDYEADVSEADDESVILLNGDDVLLRQCCAVLDDLPGKVVDAPSRADDAA